MPAGPWLYPEDQISDAPLRQLAAEITREKLYLRLHQELPYQSTVETEVWKELKDGAVRIEQTIYVERESQRKIVLGKGGQTIKAIGAAARADIAAAIEHPVHLFLFVKVREGWGDDPERYREMGLEFSPKGRLVGMGIHKGCPYVHTDQIAGRRGGPRGRPRAPTRGAATFTQTNRRGALVAALFRRHLPRRGHHEGCPYGRTRCGFSLSNSHCNGFSSM